MTMFRAVWISGFEPNGSDSCVLVVSAHLISLQPHMEHPVVRRIRPSGLLRCCTRYHVDGVAMHLQHHHVQPTPQSEGSLCQAPKLSTTLLNPNTLKQQAWSPNARSWEAWEPSRGRPRKEASSPFAMLLREDAPTGGERGLVLGLGFRVKEGLQGGLSELRKLRLQVLAAVSCVKPWAQCLTPRTHTLSLSKA